MLRLKIRDYDQTNFTYIGVHAARFSLSTVSALKTYLYSKHPPGTSEVILPDPPIGERWHYTVTFMDQAENILAIGKEWTFTIPVQKGPPVVGWDKHYPKAGNAFDGYFGEVEDGYYPTRSMLESFIPVDSTIRLIDSPDLKWHKRLINGETYIVPNNPLYIGNLEAYNKAGWFGPDGTTKTCVPSTTPSKFGGDLPQGTTKPNIGGYDYVMHIPPRAINDIVSGVRFLRNQGDYWFEYGPPPETEWWTIVGQPYNDRWNIERELTGTTSNGQIYSDDPSDVAMLPVFKVTGETLTDFTPVEDVMNVYKGILPPAATFQVIDNNDALPIEP